MTYQLIAGAKRTGSVTSVALDLGATAAAILSVAGSPITTSGTITLSLDSQTANTVLAAPSGSAGEPSFRAITALDITTALTTPPPIGGTTPNTGAFSTLSSTVDDAANTSVTRVLTLLHTTSGGGLPGTGIGVGIDLRAEYTNGVTGGLARIDALTTAGTQTADLVLSTANAGTPAEKLRLTSAGNVVLQSGAQIRPASNSTTALQLANAAGTSVLNVDTTNARVGIGTTAPVGSGLHIAVSPAALSFTPVAATTLFLQRQSAANANNALNINAAQSGQSQIFFSHEADEDIGGILYDHTSDFMLFRLDNSERARITSAGNFALGTTVPATKIHAITEDTNTATVVDILRVAHNVSGALTGANGIGAGIAFGVETSTTADTIAGRIRAFWNNATHTSRQARMVLSVYNGASEIDALTLTANGNLIVTNGAHIRPTTDAVAAFQLTTAGGTSVLNVDTSNSRIGINNTSPNSALDVTGTVQADGYRIDQAPTAETIVPTHTITINVNGTNYKIPIVAA